MRLIRSGDYILGRNGDDVFARQKHIEAYLRANFTCGWDSGGSGFGGGDSGGGGSSGDF